MTIQAQINNIASQEGMIFKTPSSDQVIQPGNINVVPLQIKSYTGGTADLFVVIDNAGDQMLRIKQDGTGIYLKDGVKIDGVDISSHVAMTSAHGVTGSVVGTTDAQTLTNKVLSTGTTWYGNVITEPYIDTAIARKTDVPVYISTHSALTSGVHGVTGDVVGTTDTQSYNK
jgi:hypothetical protein